MLPSEGRVLVHDLCSCFAQDNETHHNGLLGAFVPCEVCLGHTLRKRLHIRNGLPHVVQVVRQPAHGHTGRASWATISRNLTGKSWRVSTSTDMPSNSCSSSCKPPKSSSVVPGNVSTSRSKSLPSRSSPCRAEPNTLGLVTRWRAAAMQTASRYWRRAWEGRMPRSLPEHVISVSNRPAAPADEASEATKTVATQSPESTIISETSFSIACCKAFTTSCWVSGSRLSSRR